MKMFALRGKKRDGAARRFFVDSMDVALPWVMSGVPALKAWPLTVSSVPNMVAAPGASREAAVGL